MDLVMHLLPLLVVLVQQEVDAEQGMYSSG
jgi:hypothetical protein